MVSWLAWNSRCRPNCPWTPRVLFDSPFQVLGLKAHITLQGILVSVGCAFRFSPSLVKFFVFSVPTMYSTLPLPHSPLCFLALVCNIIGLLDQEKNPSGPSKYGVRICTASHWQEHGGLLHVCFSAFSCGKTFSCCAVDFFPLWSWNFHKGFGYRVDCADTLLVTFAPGSLIFFAVLSLALGLFHRLLCFHASSVFHGYSLSRPLSGRKHSSFPFTPALTCSFSAVTVAAWIIESPAWANFLSFFRFPIVFQPLNNIISGVVLNPATSFSPFCVLDVNSIPLLSNKANLVNFVLSFSIWRRWDGQGSSQLLFNMSLLSPGCNFRMSCRTPWLKNTLSWW